MYVYMREIISICMFVFATRATFSTKVSDYRLQHDFHEAHRSCDIIYIALYLLADTYIHLYKHFYVGKILSTHRSAANDSPLLNNTFYKLFPWRLVACGWGWLPSYLRPLQLTYLLLATALTVRQSSCSWGVSKQRAVTDDETRFPSISQQSICAIDLFASLRPYLHASDAYTNINTYIRLCSQPSICASFFFAISCLTACLSACRPACCRLRASMTREVCGVRHSACQFCRHQHTLTHTYMHTYILNCNFIVFTVVLLLVLLYSIVSSLLGIANK